MGAETWTDEYLASMRQVADPEGDEGVRRLFEEQGLEALRQFHGQILRADGVPVNGLPSYVADYLRANSAPPAWMDRDAARHAAEVLSSNGMIAFTILGCASLPECYVDGLGVPVLWLTQLMNAHVFRRGGETAQFVIGVMAPGGFEPNGPGLRAAQKVRLMHASIRHLILATPDEQLARGNAEDLAGVFRDHEWKEELGLPINQEDMAYTLQTFAWVTVRGLRDLGAGLSADQEEGIVQSWNDAGDLMGIRRELMPADVGEAELLFTRIKQRVAAPSEGGRSMQAALLNFEQSLMPTHLPGFRHLPRMAMRPLVGDGTADLLGVPELMPAEVIEARLVIDALSAGDRVRNDLFDGFSPTRKAAELVFHAMMDAFVNLPRQWERDLFQIPEQLAAGWALTRVAA